MLQTLHRCKEHVTSHNQSTGRSRSIQFRPFPPPKLSKPQTLLSSLLFLLFSLSFFPSCSIEANDGRIHKKEIGDRSADITKERSVSLGLRSAGEFFLQWESIVLMINIGKEKPLEGEGSEKGGSERGRGREVGGTRPGPGCEAETKIEARTGPGPCGLMRRRTVSRGRDTIISIPSHHV